MFNLKKQLIPLKLKMAVNNIKKHDMDIILKDKDELKMIAKTFRNGWIDDIQINMKEVAKCMGFQILRSTFPNRDTIGTIALDITLPEQSSKLKSDKVIILHKKLSDADQNLVLARLLTKYIFECPIEEKNLFRARVTLSEKQDRRHEKMNIFVSNVLTPYENVASIIEEQQSHDTPDLHETIKTVSETFCVPAAFARKRIKDVMEEMTELSNKRTEESTYRMPSKFQAPIDEDDEIEEIVEDMDDLPMGVRER